MPKKINFQLSWSIAPTFKKSFAISLPNFTHFTLGYNPVKISHFAWNITWPKIIWTSSSSSTPKSTSTTNISLPISHYSHFIIRKKVPCGVWCKLNRRRRDIESEKWIKKRKEKNTRLLHNKSDFITRNISIM